MILERTKRQGLETLREITSNQGEHYSDYVVEIASDQLIRGRSNRLVELEAHWYESIAAGSPDYEVYNTFEYLAETWICFEVYSKRYLKTIQDPKSLLPGGVFKETLLQEGAVVDLGNGPGITTAALTEMYVGRQVYGTNLDTSPQWGVAKGLSDKYGFRMVTDVAHIPNGDVALVTGFEYFEHFSSPVAHLDHVVKTLAPKQLLLANTFNGDSIGHFNEYLHEGEAVPGNKIGRIFNKRLRDHGYRSVKTGLWNQRPAYWVKP